MRVASTKKLDARMKGHMKYIARSALVKYPGVHALQASTGGETSFQIFILLGLKYNEISLT